MQFSHVFNNDQLYILFWDLNIPRRLGRDHIESVWIFFVINKKEKNDNRKEKSNEKSINVFNSFECEIKKKSSKPCVVHFV